MHTHRWRPIGFALVGVVACGPFLVGGWMPRWHAPTGDVTHSVGDLLAALLPPAIPIALLALGAAGLATGLRGLREGLAFLCGSRRAGCDLTAHRALATAARAALGAGLLMSLVGMLYLFQLTARARLVDDHASPADLAEVLTVMLVAPLFGLVLGRLVLAPAAAAAASRAGEPQRARGSISSELALFALIVPISTVFFLILVPAPL